MFLLSLSFLGTRHRFLSNLLRHFSCAANETFHKPFGMLSQSQSNIREKRYATAQALWTLPPMVPEFGKQAQIWVLTDVYVTKSLL